MLNGGTLDTASKEDKLGGGLTAAENGAEPAGSGALAAGSGRRAGGGTYCWARPSESLR